MRREWIEVQLTGNEMLVCSDCGRSIKEDIVLIEIPEEEGQVSTNILCEKCFNEWEDDGDEEIL